MAARRQTKQHSLANPVSGHEPLLIRLCSAFVDNLALLLRTALVIGAVMLVDDLRSAFPRVPATVADIPMLPAAAKGAAEQAQKDESQTDESALSEGVMHALNCTYQEFRDAHYDECVDDASMIYPRPAPGPDETGFLLRQPRVLYASAEVAPAEKASSL